MIRNRIGPRTPPDPLEILAFAEGRLAPESARGREVAHWLAVHPVDREQVESHRAQDRALQRHFASVMREPVPERLRRTLQHRPNGPRLRAAWAAGLVAAVALSMGWWTDRSPETVAPEGDLTRFASDVAGRLDARTESRGEAAFRDVLPVATIDAPVLSGFEVVDAASMQLVDRPATAYRYREARAGDRELQLFVTDAPDFEPGTRLIERGDRRAVVYWRQSDRYYALSGDLPESELRDIAAASAIEASDRRYAGTALPATAAKASALPVLAAPEAGGSATVGHEASALDSSLPPAMDPVEPAPTVLPAGTAPGPADSEL